MSAFYDQLVENGYRPRDLDNLNQDQIALLVQEEHVENVWSAAARAAAMAARKQNGKLNKKTKAILKTGYHIKDRAGPMNRTMAARDIKAARIKAKRGKQNPREAGRKAQLKAMRRIQSDDRGTY